MAAPAFQTASTVAPLAAELPVPKPSGLADGDLVVVAIGGSEGDTCTAPDGSWTEHLDTGSDETLAVYSKHITNAAGEPATWTFTSGHTKNVGAALRISGADSTTPVVVVGTPAGGSGTSVVASAIIPGVVDCLLIQASVANSGSGSWSHSVMTERVDLLSGGSGADSTKSKLQLATETLSASTTTGTRTATKTDSATYTTVLLAVQPTAASFIAKPNLMTILQAVPRAATR